MALKEINSELNNKHTITHKDANGKSQQKQQPLWLE